RDARGARRAWRLVRGALELLARRALERCFGSVQTSPVLLTTSGGVGSTGGAAGSAGDDVPCAHGSASPDSRNSITAHAVATIAAISPRTRPYFAPTEPPSPWADGSETQRMRMKTVPSAARPAVSRAGPTGSSGSEVSILRSTRKTPASVTSRTPAHAQKPADQPDTEAFKMLTGPE